MESWVKKTLITVVLLIAILLPLASAFPDGLEKVAESLGIEEMTPLWHAPLPDYAAPLIDNPYLSTLLAALIGFVLVLLVTLGLGQVLQRRKKD